MCIYIVYTSRGVVATPMACEAWAPATVTSMTSAQLWMTDVSGDKTIYIHNVYIYI